MTHMMIDTAAILRCPPPPPQVESGWGPTLKKSLVVIVVCKISYWYPKVRDFSAKPLD